MGAGEGLLVSLLALGGLVEGIERYEYGCGERGRSDVAGYGRNNADGVEHHHATGAGSNKEPADGCLPCQNVFRKQRSDEVVHADSNKANRDSGG